MVQAVGGISIRICRRVGGVPLLSRQRTDDSQPTPAGRIRLSSGVRLAGPVVLHVATPANSKQREVEVKYQVDDGYTLMAALTTAGVKPVIRSGKMTRRTRPRRGRTACRRSV